MFVDIFIRNAYFFEAKRSDPLIIDAGANIGMATLYFKFLYPKAKIIAFEPFGATFAVLMDNIELNNLKDVRLVNSALSDHAGNLSKIYYSRVRGSGTGNSLSKKVFQAKQP